MARPKNLTGVNGICATCTRDCKQSARMEVDYCPQYLARATPGDTEAAAAKGLMVDRPLRDNPRSRCPKSNRRGV